jgi:hypothetical protein
LIYTTRGEMDETTLRKVEGSIDNDIECTNWVEYWDGEEMVHRSVHVALKQGVEHILELGEF